MARTAYTDLIQRVANEEHLPFALLEAQVVEESSGNPFAFRFEPAFFQHYIRNNPKAVAKSYGPLAACSYGLLQIMLEVAVEHGFTGRPEDLFDPYRGLSAGAAYLKHLWDMAGGTDDAYKTALLCYNGGPALLHVPQAAWPVGPRAYVTNIYRMAGQIV